MINKLIEIESNLSQIISSCDMHSMYIDYHVPFVKRIWFQVGDYRVYLHKISPCEQSSDALYHPHPWKSAVRILKGNYEMGIGHSESNELPSTDCKLIIGPGSIYEMTEPNGWHYVNPIVDNCYSIMVTGEKNKREMPLTTDKHFRELTAEEISDILVVTKTYYNI